MMFVDRAKIAVRGGNGGRGCVSFRREKYEPKGGPNGGDGGDGGPVVLHATTGEQSLVELHFMPHFEGRNGEPGRGKDQHGRRGAPVVVRVPVGTWVCDADTGEALADLVAEGQEVVVAHGGRGGRGNTRFATSTHRAPRVADPGEPGEERRLQLDLKTIADVGLVGYPNAGKSTLISAITDAHPKVAPYPFTTRYPAVGVIQFPDFSRMTVADIPGLIDGAHRNVGLGHEFLRHIERSRVLVYVLDAAGVDQRQPWDDLAVLQRELELYREGLSKRPALVVANKIDLPEAAENLPELRRRVNLPMLEISAAQGTNCQRLVQELRELLASLGPAEAEPNPAPKSPA